MPGNRDKRKQSSLKGGWRIGALFMPDLVARRSTTTVASTLRLLEPLAERLYAITGNLLEDDLYTEKTQIINLRFAERNVTQTPMIVRIPSFLLMQLRLSYHFLKIANKIDIVFLAAGATTLFLPTLIAKLLGKKIISLRPGTDSLQKQARIAYQETLLGLGKYIFVPIVGFLERLSYYLADRIVVFRSDLTTPALKRYVNKIWFHGSRFYVDINSFRVEKDLNSREYTLGYIGGFDAVKGVMDFVRALPLVVREIDGIKVLLGGDGTLRGEIEEEIRNAQIGDRVVLPGWIPHEKLPQYLNDIKLLVIPSYAEAGPHMLFEAMACGTPVLVTTAGVMPDVVTDGKTGFIIEEHSPQCIAQNVIRALQHPKLGQIARAGRELMEREYTYQAAVARYRQILASLK